MCLLSKSKVTVRCEKPMVSHREHDLQIIAGWFFHIYVGSIAEGVLPTPTIEMLIELGSIDMGVS